MRPKKELRAILANWRALVDGITSLTEEEALWCLNEELATKRRKNMVARLHGRFNRLRGERELQGHILSLYSSPQGS